MSNIDYLPGCTGKIPYFSIPEAKDAARAVKRRRGQAEVYRCKHSDHWHVTTMPRGRYKRMIRSMGI